MSNRLVLSIAVATVLGAAAPAISASDVINACVGKTGALRVISARKSCSSNETPLSWNIQGPQGEQGLVGPAGAMGPAGPQGPEGPSGPGHAVAVDGDGNVIGTVIGKGSGRVAVLTDEGYEAEFMQLDGVLASTMGPIYYSGPDCTGQAYARRVPGTVGHQGYDGPVYAVPVNAESAEGAFFRSLSDSSDNQCSEPDQIGTLRPGAFEAVRNDPLVTGVPIGEWAYGSQVKAPSVPYPITIQH